MDHDNKYKNVRPIIDTGCSKTNYNIYLKEKFKDMLIKEHEGFKRIKVKSLVSILNDVESMTENLYTQTSDNEENIKFENPVLLLDVRTYQEYKECHLKGAINYPHTFLFRGANQFSNEILKYKNRNDRLIIVYDKNERLAQKVAQGLMERNILNCFLLSGGIIAMVRENPERIEGNIPDDIKEIVKGDKIEKKKNKIYFSSISSIPSIKELKPIEINHAYNKILNKTPSLEWNNKLNPPPSSINNNNNNNNININNNYNNNNYLSSNIQYGQHGHRRSSSQISYASSTSSRSSRSSTTTTTTTTSNQNSEKKFERITYYSHLKKPQPVTDPFDFSVIKKNIPLAIKKDSEENQKRFQNSKNSDLSSSASSLNSNYHALWRIKPKPITEKITHTKNKR
ncbi:Rhodanese-like protein [Neocallimastix californiae]|uniref:Rhodanese-like protein n=1 Tax=Neocallimastix californiae TaxID=1754190 RepID=A0A1Y2EUC7_9FUNG|nr:Rhodanese-like protein [Neocallimastix californiae]|eukprot:ORY75173.1 Rhodanese-like protein [Neocallimastix californiae]